jgi:hypothetical protein
MGKDVVRNNLDAAVLKEVNRASESIFDTITDAVRVSERE